MVDLLRNMFEAMCEARCRVCGRSERLPTEDQARRWAAQHYC